MTFVRAVLHAHKLQQPFHAHAIEACRSADALGTSYTQGVIKACMCATHSIAKGYTGDMSQEMDMCRQSATRAYNDAHTCASGCYPCNGSRVGQHPADRQSAAAAHLASFLCCHTHVLHPLQAQALLHRPHGLGPGHRKAKSSTTGNQRQI